MAAGLAVGAVYSLPPFRLKRFPVAASLCITGRARVVVNLGVYWHFAGADRPAGVGAVPVRAPVQPRDRRPQGRSGPRGRPPVQHPDVHGPARRRAGVPGRFGALLIAYAGMILVARSLLARLRQSGRPGGRPLRRRDAALVLGEAAIRRYHTKFTRFYMRVWALFFLEYLLVPARLPRTVIFDVRARTSRHGWPDRRGQASTREVGLSAMSIASQGGSAALVLGRPPASPSQRFAGSQEPNTISASQARAARRREARRDEQAVAAAARDLRPATLAAGRRPRGGVPRTY